MSVAPGPPRIPPDKPPVHPPGTQFTIVYRTPQPPQYPTEAARRQAIEEGLAQTFKSYAGTEWLTTDPITGYNVAQLGKGVPPGQVYAWTPLDIYNIASTGLLLTAAGSAVSKTVSPPSPPAPEFKGYDPYQLSQFLHGRAQLEQAARIEVLSEAPFSYGFKPAGTPIGYMQTITPQLSAYYGQTAFLLLQTEIETPPIMQRTLPMLFKIPSGPTPISLILPPVPFVAPTQQPLKTRTSLVDVFIGGMQTPSIQPMTMQTGLTRQTQSLTTEQIQRAVPQQVSQALEMPTPSRTIQSMEYPTFDTFPRRQRRRQPLHVPSFIAQYGRINPLAMPKDVLKGFWK